MADLKRASNGPSPYEDIGYDFTQLPDFDEDFVNEDDIAAFAQALSAPDAAVSRQDALDEEAAQKTNGTEFITALNDWRPVHQRVRKPAQGTKKRRKKPRRGKDETREGFVYILLKWPLLLLVLGWIILLGAMYIITRTYISLYEYIVIMRGKREKLRREMGQTTNYADWVDKAKRMDTFLGNDKWKQADDYAYYNSDTVRSVHDQLRSLRTRLERSERRGTERAEIADELRMLIEASVKNNFVGVEGARLYSETYYGTKDLVQSFVNEVEASLKALSQCESMQPDQKSTMFRHLHTNYGRTALCLSGGACFSYYHFGVAKALLDANILPEVITGTSGGGLVAALLCTRTDDELKRLLVPALAHRINACHDPFHVWIRRWWRTGARFDAVDWARRSAWFCHGNLTFREAYERTGRILNVTCVPSDPHTPTILANYKTSPDCVIWSAILASAAVPGILNPVVLMKKNKNGALTPYSFGHKWKDGSLRTDIPLKQLNTYFNVSFSIVSQVNPHVNLFFFSSRGTVGRPVSHRRGRGWRGGFLGSALEQYIKLDLAKWLKVLRHLELLPRYLGQDWSELWLQHFSGTITIWPKTVISDYFNILSDPTPARLARMLQFGQQSAFPKLKFVSNRIKIERIIETGRRVDPTEVSDYETPSNTLKRRPRPLTGMLSADDLRTLLEEAKRREGPVSVEDVLSPPEHTEQVPQLLTPDTATPQKSPNSENGIRGRSSRTASPSISKRLAQWWPSTSAASPHSEADQDDMTDGTTNNQGQSHLERPLGEVDWHGAKVHRRSSLMEELSRQGSVFFDELEAEGESGGESSLAESATGSASEQGNATKSSGYGLFDAVRQASQS